MSKTTTATLAALTLAASLASGTAAFAQCDPGEMTIKFSHVTNADRHPKGIAAQLFADRVNEEMNGRVCVEVYPNSTLYDDDKVLEAMLAGDVQMAAPSLSKFEAFTKVFSIFDLPFMFKNMDAVDEFQASEVGQEMKASMERRGLLGLEFWHSGMKQFSANTPLVLPEDAEGLKFRVQPSDVLIAQMEALGASPQPMAFSEVYGALQMGVVDGQENTWSNIYGQKFHEVQDGITETNHGVLDYLVVVSVDWWDGLDPAVRDDLSRILHEVTETRNAQVNEVEAKSRQAIIDAGYTVRELTPEQRAAWAATMRPVWDQFKDGIGEEKIDFAQEVNTRH
ncbi:TRAP transporter substrate-binding protein [Phaeovulum vinaykumarii]|uniref:C4-dicarboxylate-binding protein DctP n=1 Tax=Phaeovulum vinaykumarii TaxID=407234 RepID=A0A1N7MBA6_9RHOB|nr:TRAP transporter substrate-binding protein [Phaeovulum vinaykumarii]SIS83261.1 C4-dicarboxylate-binding protein DctP [Phaeovulum vinaykumarii]SOC10330.1 C4-dicarboxylate-binding protein DctP [Phaeovulum vinaykumarii]